MKSFFLTNDAFLNIETGTYIPILVIASYIVASLASYTALDLANYIPKTNNKLHQKILHLSGSFALGAGIWSMHFIGMLAYKMDMAISYSIFWTIISIIPALIVSYFVLDIIKKGKISFVRIVLSAVLLGIGICLMHYTGMFAMQMDGDIFYRPGLFALSILIAITASGAALVIAFFLTYKIQQYHFMLRILAALIMGAAICGMHYTGMAATVFSAWADCRYDPEQSFVGIALSIAILAFFIISLALFLRITLDSSHARNRKILGIKSLYIPVISIFLLGASISSISFYYVHQKLALEQHQEYQQAAEQYSDAIESHIQRHIQLLNSMKTFYDASLLVDRSKFKIIAAALLIEFPELISLHYIPEIKTEEIEQHLKSAGDSFKSYQIKDNPEFTGKSELIYPVLYTEPQEKYQESIGYNLASYPDTIDLLQSALNSPDVISGPDIFSFLSTPKPIETNFTLLISTSNNQNGNNDSAGLLVSRIDTQEFLNQLNSKTSKKQKNLSISIKGLIEFPSSTQVLNEPFKSTVNIADKTWDVSYIIKNDQFDHSRWEELTILIGGIILSLMVSAYACMILRQKERDASLNDQLNVEKTYLNAILENMLQGVITINEDGKIQTFNNLAEVIFGYKKDEVIGHNVNILMPNPHHKKHDGYLQNYKKTQKAKMLGGSREVEAKNKNGKIFPILLRITKININDTVIFIGLVMDITEQKEKENLLKQAKKEAEHASAAKSDFLANMSHELRTPLNSIVGLTRMLSEDETMDIENKEMIKIVGQSANNLLELVNDILDISKIESGHMILEEIGFDLTEIVENVVNTIAPIASGKGVSLKYTQMNESIPYIIGDPFRMSRVLTNLISNAIKYTHEGKVEVLLNCTKIDNSSVYIECSVLDTGVGIPEDKLTIIFDKFTQADLSTTREFGGTGLGLAITKEIIDMMGGEIGVNSTINEGSCFWFKIKFKTTSNVNSGIKKVLQKDQRKKERKVNRINVEDAKILIAEDHLMNQDFIKRLLKRMGFVNFDIVDNGELAVQKAMNDQYDIILMDCHMPEKNGYEATKDIRNNKNFIPIIAMTADVMKGTKEKCLKAGMNQYIGKPIDSDKLKIILEQWIIFSHKQTKDTKAPKVSQEIEMEAPVDLDLLTEYADNDEDLKYFINIFLQQSTQGINDMEKSCVDGECEEWVGAAHKLKGGAGMIGAKNLYLLCAQAQEMNDVASEVREIAIKNIRDEYTIVTNYLDKYIANK